MTKSDSSTDAILRITRGDLKDFKTEIKDRIRDIEEKANKTDLDVTKIEVRLESVERRPNHQKLIAWLLGVLALITAVSALVRWWLS